jgi:hypothetical protein
MFEGRQQQDILTVDLKTGERHTGSYLTQAGMHFLSVKADGLLPKVVGPFDVEDVTSVTVEQSRDEVMSTRRDRLLGERLPGRDPMTAEEIEYRLRRLARASAESAGERRSQLHRQFNELADHVTLAKSKRTWMLAEARWSMTSNAPPTMFDLWGYDVASPSLLRRPATKDFDPDPVVRRSRDRLPLEVSNDPFSVPNMLRRLRRDGFDPTVQLAGDPPWERAVLQVDLLKGRTGRFVLDGRKNEVRMQWELKWGGNDSAAGRKHRERAVRLEDYPKLVAATRQGFDTTARDNAPRGSDDPHASSGLRR